MKVIFDTNVWISFLIGKRLGMIRSYIADNRIAIITTTQLLAEIQGVTGRPKLKKYFPEESVADLIRLLKAIDVNFEITPINFDSRDPKDNFLLDLSIASGADYLVTGDKDLLVLHPFHDTKILKPSDFEQILLNG